MSGAARDTYLNAQRKAYTAARSDAFTTRQLAEKAGGSPTELASFDPLFSFFLGGVAAFREGTRVGAVGVSGLPGEVDEQLAIAAIRAAGLDAPAVAGSGADEERAQPLALRREVEAERQEHERVDDDEGDRERKPGADELAEHGERDSGGRRGQDAAPLVRAGEDPLRPPGHSREHHGVGRDRRDRGAHHPVRRNQGQVEGHVDDRGDAGDRPS